MGAKRLGLTDPAGRQALAHDGMGIKRMCVAGFTLIELLVVVLIIGILTAVALPQYRVAVERARVARALPVLRALVQAKTRYYLANGEHTADMDMLDVQVSYESKEERGEEDSWIYRGTPIGVIQIDPAGSGVYWAGPSVVIDTFPSSQFCYAFPSDKAELGNKVCASFGPETGRMSPSGTPVYNVVF